MAADNKENIDSSYIRTDEDELGSQVQLLKVKTNTNNNNTAAK